MTDQPAPDTVVFIHGLWMTPRSWEHWVTRFEGLGYKTIAPSWPGFEGEVEDLRSGNGSTIKGVTAGDVIGHYESIVKALDRPPILVGHSFGGAFVQILLDKGLGAAGVAVDPAPLRGIRDLPISTLRSSFGVLGNPLNFGKAVPFTKSQFKYAFGNTVSQAESDAAWERYAVPAASKVLFEGAAANINPKTPLQVDWKKSDRAPLLLLGGGDDHVVPAKVTKKTAAKYAKGSTAVTEYKEYPARSHWTAGEPGWEAVADHAIEWVQARVGAPVAA
jgi:alpha-beta hydrolase superfamily lysophospholipase